MRIYQFEHKDQGVDEGIRFKFCLVKDGQGTSLENDGSIYLWTEVAYHSWLFKPPVARNFKYIKD